MEQKKSAPQTVAAALKGMNNIQHSQHSTGAYDGTIPGAVDCAEKYGWLFTLLTGKQPMLKDWQKRPANIDGMTAHGGNFGLLTGAMSGVDVLDIDDVEAYDKLIANLPPTPMVRTGRGGLHAYFQHADGVRNSAGKVGTRIDVRGDGGQVVFPGSVHPDTGALYEWVEGRSPDEVSLAEWPPELLDKARTKSKPPVLSSGLVPDASSHVQKKYSRYAQAALNGECHNVRTAPEGQRNDTLNTSACKMGGLVAGGVLEAERVAAELARAAIESGLGEHETSVTIKSGMTAGMQTPRGPAAHCAHLADLPEAGEKQPIEGTTDAEHPEPIPLFRDIGESEPLPMEMLPPIICDAVRGIMETIQVPDALALNAVLGAAAVAVQAHADAMIDGRSIPLSLFLQTVAESGDRKTSADKVALAEHRRFTEELSLEYEEAMGLFKCHEKAYAISVGLVEREGKSKKMSRENIAEELQKLGPPPEPPMEPYMLTGNMTVEGVHRMLRLGRPSLGIFADEGGAIVGGHTMQRENILKALAEFSKFWDGTGDVRARVGEGVSALFGRRVSMHLQMQGDVFRILMGQQIATTQGFMPRCLVAWPKSFRGDRLYQEADPYEHPGIRHFHERMRVVLERPLPLSRDRTRGLEPRKLPLTDAAKRLYIELYNNVETQNSPDGPLDSIYGWASKAGEHAVRIAGVMQLTEDIESPAITEEIMFSGIVLAEFFMCEIARLAGLATMPPDKLLAKKTLDWMRARKEDIFTSKVLMQYGPNAVRDSETVDRVMDILVGHGYVTPVPGRKSWKLRQ